MDWKISQITKPEAATRQLNQAIRLHFSGGDMLAVHTLAAASLQLLIDLGKLSGVESRYRSEELIRPGKRKECIAILNSTQNFLKHADRDSAQTYRYVEEGTILLLWEVVELATQLGLGNRREHLAFQMWFAAAFPELINPPVLAALQAANSYGLDQRDRYLWARWLAEA
jgi:hypothetical protein